MLLYIITGVVLILAMLLAAMGFRDLVRYRRIRNM
jgi:hypothetical protein